MIKKNTVENGMIEKVRQVVLGISISNDAQSRRTYEMEKPLATKE